MLGTLTKEDVELLLPDKPDLPDLAGTHEVSCERIESATDAMWAAHFNKSRERSPKRNDTSRVLCNDMEFDSKVDVSVSFLTMKKAPCLVGEGAIFALY